MFSLDQGLNLEPHAFCVSIQTTIPHSDSRYTFVSRMSLGGTTCMWFESQSIQILLINIIYNLVFIHNLKMISLGDVFCS